MACSFKQWHKSVQIIVSNNRNYNLKGIIDNYDFCHNRAALVYSFSLKRLALAPSDALTERLRVPLTEMLLARFNVFEMCCFP